MMLETTMLVEAWRWIDLRIPADLFDAASYNLIISLGRSAAPMISIFCNSWYLSRPHFSRESERRRNRKVDIPVG